MGLDRLADQVEKEGRDMSILRTVVEHGPIGIVSIADETGVHEHKVRYSLRMLEDGEFVEPTPQGAVPADDVGERLAAVDDGMDALVERLEELKAEFDGLPE